jgi:hypothetical protein
MVYKRQRARSGGVLHGARPGWLNRHLELMYFILYDIKFPQYQV